MVNESTPQPHLRNFIVYPLHDLLHFK